MTRKVYSVVVALAVLAAALVTVGRAASAADGECNCAAQEAALTAAENDLATKREDLVDRQKVVDFVRTRIEILTAEIPVLEERIDTMEEVDGDYEDYASSLKTWEKYIVAAAKSHTSFANDLHRDADRAERRGDNGLAAFYRGVGTWVDSLADDLNTTTELVRGGFAEEAMDRLSSLTGAYAFLTKYVPLKHPLAFLMRAAIRLAISAIQIYRLPLSATIWALDMEEDGPGYREGKPYDENGDGKLSDDIKLTEDKLEDAERELEEMEEDLPVFEEDLEKAKAAVDDAVEVRDEAERALRECERQNDCDPPCDVPPCDPPCSTPPCPPPPPSKDSDLDGDPHLRTFDGLAYDFQAEGEFVHVDSLDDDFEVQIRTHLWQGEHVSVADEVAARTPQGQIVRFGLASVSVDGEPVTGAVLLEGGAQLTDRTLTLADGTQVQANPVAESYLSINVAVPPSREGRVRGLVGDANGDWQDDLRALGGDPLEASTIGDGAGFDEFYDVFAASWIPAADDRLFADPIREFVKPLPAPSFDELGDAAVAAALSSCLAQGWTIDNGLANCVFDVASTGDDLFADPAAQSEDWGDAEAAGNAPDLGEIAEVVVPFGEVGQMAFAGSEERVALLDVPAGAVGLVDLQGTGNECFAIFVTLTSPDGVEWDGNPMVGTDPAVDGGCGAISTPVAEVDQTWRISIAPWGFLGPDDLVARVTAVTPAEVDASGSGELSIPAGEARVLTTPVAPIEFVAWIAGSGSCGTDRSAAASGVRHDAGLSGSPIYSTAVPLGCSVTATSAFEPLGGRAQLVLSNLAGSAARSVEYRPVVVAGSAPLPLDVAHVVPLVSAPLAAGGGGAPYGELTMQAGQTLDVSIGDCPSGGEGDVSVRIFGPTDSPESSGLRTTLPVRVAGTCVETFSYTADVDGVYSLQFLGGLGASLPVTATVG